MTHLEREAIRKKMSTKLYLYEVYRLTKIGGRLQLGSVLADTDIEAIEYAIKCFPDANLIRRDHWGYGPFIELAK